MNATNNRYILNLSDESNDFKNNNKTIAVNFMYCLHTALNYPDSKMASDIDKRTNFINYCAENRQKFSGSELTKSVNNYFLNYTPVSYKNKSSWYIVDNRNNDIFNVEEFINDVYKNKVDYKQLKEAFSYLVKIMDKYTPLKQSPETMSNTKTHSR